jgi:hypothetical protein
MKLFLYVQNYKHDSDLLSHRANLTYSESESEKIIQSNRSLCRIIINLLFLTVSSHTLQGLKERWRCKSAAPYPLQRYTNIDVMYECDLNRQMKDQTQFAAEMRV